MTQHNKTLGEFIINKQSDYRMAIESWNLRAKLPIFLATIKQGTNTDIKAYQFY